MTMFQPVNNGGQGLFSAGNAFGQTAGQAFQNYSQWLQANDPSYANAPKLPGVDDFSADRQRIEQALFGRARGELDTRYNQETAEFEQRMANQGVDIGSERYKRERALFDKSRNEAYNDAQFRAMIAGGDEQSRLFGMGLQARQQAVNEADSLRATRMNELAALMNPAMQMEGFITQRDIANQQDQTARYGIDRNFESAGLDRSSRERLADLDRQFQEAQQGRQFNFQAGQNEADRVFQQGQQGRQFDFTSGQNTLDRQQQLALLQDAQRFQGRENRRDRRVQREQIAASRPRGGGGGGGAAMDPAALLGLVQALTGERLSG